MHGDMLGSGFYEGYKRMHTQKHTQAAYLHLKPEASNLGHVADWGLWHPRLLLLSLTAAHPLILVLQRCQLFSHLHEHLSCAIATDTVTQRAQQQQ